MGKKNMKIKRKKIALDADYLIFMCTEGKDVKGSYFGAEDGSVGTKKGYKESLKPYIEKFKFLVQEVEDEIAATLVGEIKGIKVILSDSNTNFRYKMYPEYKGVRPERSKLFYRLRKWAEKEYGYVKGIEADDECAYLVREKGWIGASMDKDLLRGVAGTWYNVHFMHRKFVITEELEARNFNLIQTLTGDPTDNIKALPKKAGTGMIPLDELPAGKTRQPFKVTEKLAIELLDKYGWDWAGVIAAFEEKGFGEKEALLNRRLIGMDQSFPSKKKGSKKWKIRLWIP